MHFARSGEVGDQVVGQDWSVVGGNPVPADDAAARANAMQWRETAQAARELQHRQRARYAGLDAIWTGPAATVWAATGGRIADDITEPAAQLDTMAAAMETFADVVARLKEEAAPLLMLAHSYQDELDAAQWLARAGSVGFVDAPYVQSLTATDATQAEDLRARLAQVRAQVDEIRAAYHAAETRCARALDEVTAGAMVSQERALSDPALHEIAKLALAEAEGREDEVAAVLAALTPEAVASLWRDLTPDQHVMLIEKDPYAIGNADGIPIADRDRANRRALPELRAEIIAAVEAWQAKEPAMYDDSVRLELPRGMNPRGRKPVYAGPTDAWTAWNDHMDRLRQQLAGLDAVVRTLADKRHPVAVHLVGLQPTVGWGRVIIATGDPDTAGDVAIYVPGMGTNPTGIAEGVRRSDRMYGAARRAKENPTAVITWFGYDAPQSLGPAAELDHAQHGARLLDQFATGLRATHVGPRSLTTVIAHSYGTTLTGYAASHGHLLDVDNVVFVGSPGTSVDDADDLHLDGPVGANLQHVFASTAPHDPIALVSGIDGVDPTDPSYGATTFTSDGKAGPWYTLGWNVDAHSGYWGTRNKALKLMGGIIAGKGTHLP